MIKRSGNARTLELDPAQGAQGSIRTVAAAFRIEMSDDKPKWDTPTNVESSKPNEVGELARKHSISPDRAQMLIDRYGHDPEKLDAEAAKLRPKG